MVFFIYFFSPEYKRTVLYLSSAITVTSLATCCCRYWFCLIATKYCSSVDGEGATTTFAPGCASGSGDGSGADGDARGRPLLDPERLFVRSLTRWLTYQIVAQQPILIFFHRCGATAAPSLRPLSSPQHQRQRDFPCTLDVPTGTRILLRFAVVVYG